MREADHQEAEDGYYDDHFEQGEPTLRCAPMPVRPRDHWPPAAAPSRNVLSTTDRRQRLPRGQRLDAKRPAITAAIISGELSLDQRRVPADRRKVRLGALHGLLGSGCGVHSKQPAASRA